MSKKIELYSASWCSPCKVFKGMELPKLESLGYEIELIDIETNDGQERAQTNRIRGVPTIMAFKDDTLVKTFVGMTTAVQIEEVLN